MRYRSAFDLAEAAATGTRKELISRLTAADLLILEELGARTLPPNAADDLLEIFTRRYETGVALAELCDGGLIWALLFSVGLHLQALTASSHVAAISKAPSESNVPPPVGCERPGS